MFALASDAKAIIIDFETTPNIPLQGSLFSSAGPPQVITVGDVVTITGGVVLGFPTNLPDSPFATSPNLYGTAYHPSGNVFGDISLTNMLSIEIDLTLNAMNVDGLLYNGLRMTDTILLFAFSEGMEVASLSFELPAFESEFSVFRLVSEFLPIDLVTITSDLGGADPGEWDFFIDTLAIGEPINVVPEPGSFLLLASGLVALSSSRRRDRRRRE
jgi:hypothetical protein